MNPRPLVAVLVGTDSHRFDRLIGWVEALAALGESTWFVQHGATRAPRDDLSSLSSAAMLTEASLQDLLHRADAVVTHGGPGLIMEARALGHRPVVVPRDPAHREHVDRHQLMFAARLARADLVDVADSLGSLRACVARQALQGRGSEHHERSGQLASARLATLVDDLLKRG